MHGFAVIFVKVQIHTQLQNTFFEASGGEPQEGLNVKKRTFGFFLVKSGETGTAHQSVRSSSHRVQGKAAAHGDSRHPHQQKRLSV